MESKMEQNKERNIMVEKSKLKKIEEDFSINKFIKKSNNWSNQHRERKSGLLVNKYKNYLKRLKKNDG